MSDATNPATPESVAAQLKVLAHTTRLKILQILRKPGAALSVTEIFQAAGIPQAIASQHLITLKDRGILSSRKEGTKIFYSIAQPWVLEIVKTLEKQAGHVS